MAASPVFPDAAQVVGDTIVAADTTTLMTMFTGVTNGSILKSLSVCTDDSSDVTLQVWWGDGTDYLLGTVTVTTLAGTDGSEPAVDLMDANLIPAFADGQFFLANTETIKVGATAAVTAAKTVYLVAKGVDL